MGALVLGAVVSSRADATVTLAPTSGSIFPTQSTSVTATITSPFRIGIPPGTYTLAVTGLPSGVATIPAVVTYSVFGVAIQHTAAVTFLIAAGGQAAAGTYTVNVADPNFGSATYALTIPEPQLRIFPKLPAFTLGGTPVAETVGFFPDPGFGFNAQAGLPVVFAVDAGGAPANVTAGGPKTLLPAFNVPLTFTFRRTGPVTGGVYVVPVTATWTGTRGNVLTSSANVTVTVPDIGVSVGPPAAVSACNGGLTAPSPSVTFTPLGNYQGQPSVAVLNAPGGVTVTPPPPFALPPPQTAAFQLLAAGAAAGGQTFTAHVFDAAAGIDRSFTVPFQVINPDIVPSAVPSSLALQAGGPSAPFAVTATPPPATCGTPPFVTVSLTGLPSGFVVPAPVTLQPPVYGTVPMPVSAGASVAPATYPATLHFAPSTGAAKDVPVSISVAAAPIPPDFLLTAVPSALTLTPGASGKVTFTVMPQGGFNAAVTLTVPSNANVSAAPPTYTFPAGGGSVVVTFTAAPNATAATIPVSVSAAGGGGLTISHTVSVTVVVQPPPADFNLRVSPPAPSVPAGRATPLAFALDALGGFSGSATLTAVQLPPGATLSPASLVLTPGAAQTASLAVPRATPPGPYTLVFRADEVPAPTARRALLISKTVSVPLVVQPPVGGFTVTVSPAAILAKPDQAVAVRYELHNLGGAPLTITGDAFVLRDRNGGVLGSTDEPFTAVLPANGTTVVSNTVLVTGAQFAKTGAPPVALADRTFRAAPDATGYTDTATATVTVTAANSLLSTASATRISVVYPPSGTLVGRGDSLKAQGLVIGSGTGNLLVGWFFDGILVETATVPLQNGTPTSVSSAVTLPTLVSGNHEISLAVLAPNTLSSPEVQIYVEEGQQTLRLVTPTAGAVLAPAFGAPTFSWIPVPGVARYGVGLRRRAPGAPWRWTFTTDTRWSPPAALWNSLPEGDYEWGVRGFTNSGRVFLDSQSGGASAPPTSEGAPDMAEGWTVTSSQGRFSIGGSEKLLQDLGGRASAEDVGVRFVWNAIPGAFYVHSLYEQGPEGLRRVRTEVLNKPGLLIPSAAMPRGGPFLWRVSAVDGEGRPLGTMAAAPVPAARGSR
ncbi:MAG TPA: hypothetical protein VMN04_14715 [Thermoanaerobaculia bacterium]|nr:hypothetical protein [Thermoanaerobaculia bacterium]